MLQAVTFARGASEFQKSFRSRQPLLLPPCPAPRSRPPEPDLAADTTASAMHVPNRATGRKDVFYAAVLRSLDRWRRGPAVLLGDTNSGRPGIDEESPAFGPKGAAWLETLERSGWRDAFWYSPNKGNGFRIDQAFVNHDLQPRLRDVRYDWGRRARPPTNTLSDHAALLLDLHG